jgi:hypothetical protein
MPTDGKRLLAGYEALDAKLARAGRHPTSREWLATLKRFWLSGKTRLVVRKGRQAGGSTTMARVAVATALFGVHRSPPGTRIGFPFISVKMEETGERIENIADTLDVAGIPYTRRGDRIELSDRPFFFLVLPCSYRTNVGGTNGSAWEDETARWWSSEANANPAVEVDASLVPSLVTQPNARIYTISSPLGLDDFHAELFARGETPDQCIADGPSWYWNPTITEAATHALQSDERRWRREFAAQPQAGALSAFDARQIDRAMATEVPNEWPASDRVVLVDPTAGASDTFAYCAAGWRRAPGGGQSILEICEVNGVAEASKQGFTSDTMVREIAKVARRHDAVVIHSDQFERFSLASAFARSGFTFVPHVWTAPAKERCVEHVRRWLHDGLLALPKHDRLRQELLAFEERIARVAP